jgi:hypothetical protein
MAEPVKVKISELKLRDVVSLGDWPFSTAVVQKVDDDAVTLFRPYVHTSDFSYTGGVITYIGTETVTLWRKDSREVVVLERHDVK